MLGDIKRTLDNFEDQNPDVAKAIEAYMDACTATMAAMGAPLERLKHFMENNAQTTLETQVLAQLLANVGKIAQDSYTATINSIVIAAASAHLNKMQEQAQKLQLLKGKRQD